MIENTSPKGYNLKKKYKQYDPLDVMNTNNTIVSKLTSIKKRKHDTRRYGTISPKGHKIPSLNREARDREAKRISAENGKMLDRLSS